MRAASVLLGFLAVLMVPAAVRGQEHARHGEPGVSPYADYREREIKVLSPEETEGLLRGDGMEMALPAELHGYPGPRHVLELAAELELTPSQRAAAERISGSMKARATALGRRIVELERELDEAFEEGTIDAEVLGRLVNEIGRRRAELRSAHLAAHLELYPVLSAAQRAAYGRLRGYGH